MATKEQFVIYKTYAFNHYVESATIKCVQMLLFTLKLEI